MILKTLSNNDNVATPDLGDGIQHYNKCKYCDKVFLNQLYLKGHVLRRHQGHNEHDNLKTDVNKASEDINKNEHINPNVNDNFKLHTEIKELELKLQDMDAKLETANTKLSQIGTESRFETASPAININADVIQQSIENQKDILEKIEKWKIEEQEKYKAEISLLKEQILENINAIKDKHNNITQPKETDIVPQLRSIVQDQNLEIAALKQELTVVVSNHLYIKFNIYLSTPLIYGY